MFGRRYGIPNPLHISTAGRNELECTGSSHPRECSHRMNMTEYLRTNPTLPYRDSIMNGSRKESALSPQSLFSYDGEYLSPSLKKFQEGAKDNFLIELSGESNFHELPDSSLLPELPEDSLDHYQSTLVAGRSFLNNKKRISSISRAIVSPSSASNSYFQSLDTLEAGLTVITECPRVDGEKVGYRTPWYNETQDLTPSAGHGLSNTFGFGNTAEAEMVDKTAEIRIQMDAAYLSQDSSISMPLQSPRSLGSMCPAIQTDLRRFKSNLDATQHQRGLFEDSPQISSPDTASTNTSGETFSSDSGYGPRAPQSDYTSATSPRSLFPGDEQLGFENAFFSKPGQLVSPPEFNIDQRLPNNNFSIDDAAQYLQSTIQRGFGCLKNIVPGAENCETADAAIFTPAMETENQYAPNIFGTYEEKHASPWSAENVRGFNKNFNFATIPETQLPIEEEQTRTSTYDTPSPKSNNKVMKCSYPECNYEPSGEDQWKLGNLRRHEKEHKISLKDRIVCKMSDCKATFTRAGNRDAHLENIHGAVILRQKRIRRNSTAENTKQPRAGRRITKVPRKAGGLINRPKQNRSQSVPELLKSTEF
ncbi:hypothetical protein BTUL_0030g00070 [Botrytis tulipae]|uniref:C2H2-type domain-containing protein n=1 Tax=Botrytis tulipae TaxID=87230 RepID=A0A4Z1EUV6_9HELO|nr:hypothetical protein BTUL_0030g00070 [Botrytis tulipae]